ncbi:MAG: hypothetical protein WB439_12705, partial [Acidobacteriaceae bacterium]
TETLLKLSITNCVEIVSEINAAYLVRLSYGETPGIGVALCLEGKPLAPETLVRCIETAFMRIFASTQHLDILFFSKVEIASVAAIAKPFFTRVRRSTGSPSEI